MPSDRTCGFLMQLRDLFDLDDLSPEHTLILAAIKISEMLSEYGRIASHEEFGLARVAAEAKFRVAHSEVGELFDVLKIRPESLEGLGADFFFAPGKISPNEKHPIIGFREENIEFAERIALGQATGLRLKDSKKRSKLDSPFTKTAAAVISAFVQARTLYSRVSQITSEADEIADLHSALRLHAKVTIRALEELGVRRMGPPRKIPQEEIAKINGLFLESLSLPDLSKATSDDWGNLVAEIVTVLIGTIEGSIFTEANPNGRGNQTFRASFRKAAEALSAPQEQ